MDDLIQDFLKSCDFNSYNSVIDTWMKNYYNKFVKNAPNNNVSDIQNNLNTLIYLVKAINELTYSHLNCNSEKLLNIETSLSYICQDIIKSFKLKEYKSDLKIVFELIKCLCGNKYFQLFNSAILRPFILKLKEEGLIDKFNNEYAKQLLNLMKFDIFIEFDTRNDQFLKYFQILNPNWSEIFRMCIHHLSDEQFLASIDEVQSLYE